MTAPALILNVDDTEAARYAKTRTLQRAGFRVVEAATGREALARVSELQPPLVLLDISLPDMSGLDVCRLLKRDHPAVMVLQTSAAMVSGGDRVRGLDSGADSYLAQPVEPDELVAVVRSLLRLRDAEEALRKANETLEQRVVERTYELDTANRQLRHEIEERERAEDALRQSQKMEAIGQLTGGIAHDFNNLLTAIVGNLDLLQRRLAQGRGDVERFAQAAREGAERATVLTQRLLAFSRRQPLTPRAADLNQLIDGMSDLLHRTVGEQVRVETCLAGDLWPAWCDANQLENALLNLAINARDAMSDGGVLTIGTENLGFPEPMQEIAAGDYVRIGVSDTGSGMTPDVAAKAFDPFFTTKPIGQGTGLGLSMLYGFMKQSGGHVSIDTAPGQGTTINLYLPRYTGKVPARAAAPWIEQPTPAAGRGGTILVVEDESLVRAMIHETLEDAGYSILGAADGAAAIEIVESDRQIDLLLTDVGLPGMNGRQLAEATQARRPGLQVLFMTGYAAIAPDGAPTLPDGLAVIGKPFTAQALTAKVAAMLRR